MIEYWGGNMNILMDNCLLRQKINEHCMNGLTKCLKNPYFHLTDALSALKESVSL